MNLRTLLLILPLIMPTACSSTPPAKSKGASSKLLANAVPNAKAPVLAIITRADWCSVCGANTNRVTALLGPKAAQGEIEIVINDITDEERAKSSRAALEERHLNAAVPDTTGAGLISFVGAQDGAVVAQVTVAHSDTEITHVLALAKARAGAAR